MSPILAVNNLSYAYPQPNPADSPIWVLDGVDFAVETGEFVAIMGATGVGKSTLCLALNGIIPHSTGGTIGGDVWVRELNTQEHKVPALSQLVGVVFQDPETQLFNMSVETEVAFGLENLGLPRADMDERINWALGLVGMAECRHLSPFQLSGGQKQRVAIAAILAMRPAILVLDEPTAHLDPLGMAELFAALRTLRQEYDTTTIMVSHHSDMIAEFADRVLVLNAGKIAISGSPHALFSEVETMQQLGLAVPQVSQIAHQLRQQGAGNFAFTQLDEAVHVLRSKNPRPQPLSLEREGDERSSLGEGLLTIKNLQFNYTNEISVLKGVSFNIDKGETVAILGQNGAGKTTLAKHLNGLLRPKSGHVLLNGMDIAGIPTGKLAKTIAYVFQNPDHQIFSPTVREELAFGPRNLGLTEPEIEARVAETLQMFSLEQVADQQPTTLSFGLRRTVTTAAAVAMRPDILILDEPTSGLDEQNKRTLLQILQKWQANGGTILTITHDMQFVAALCSRCLVLAQGRILFDGTPRTLFQQGDILATAHLTPPQVTRLAKALNMASLPLTVAEFCRHFPQQSPISNPPQRSVHDH